jgi:hypothetical protein
MVKKRTATKPAAAPQAEIIALSGKRRRVIALEAAWQMECLFNAILDQGRVIDDVDDSSVIKALALRGVALTGAAIAALGDDSKAALSAEYIEELEDLVMKMPLGEASRA